MQTNIAKKIQPTLNRLDAVMTKVDRLVEIIEKTITTLKEYRTTLISAIITGKINVTDVDVKEDCL